MKLNHLWMLILVTTLSVGLGSCGKKKDDKEEGGGGDIALTGYAAFVGNWSGNYRALNGDGKPEGESTRIEANFSEDGNFAIVVTDDKTAYAKGTWQEFGGKSLFLDVKHSSISRIGGTKTNIDAAYTILGSSAYIHNEDFELKITRKSNTSDSSNGGSGTSPSGVAGKWSCSGNGKNTLLVVSNDLNWRATISSEGHSTMIASGSGFGSEGSYILKIESSQPAVKAGSVLSLTLVGTQAQLTTIGASGEKDSLGDCHRE